MPKTLYEKLWESHVVRQEADGTTLLYVDRHLLHEVSSPQAFEGLRQAGRRVWRSDANLAMADHNVPTTGGTTIADPAARLQVETLLRNCAAHGITAFGMGDPRQGIVHVVGPDTLRMRETVRVLANAPLAAIPPFALVIPAPVMAPPVQVVKPDTLSVPVP